LFSKQQILRAALFVPLLESLFVKHLVYFKKLNKVYSFCDVLFLTSLQIKQAPAEGSDVFFNVLSSLKFSNLKVKLRHLAESG